MTAARNSKSRRRRFGSLPVANTVLASYTPMPAPALPGPRLCGPISGRSHRRAYRCRYSHSGADQSDRHAGRLLDHGHRPHADTSPVPAGVRVPADDPAIEAGTVTFPGDGLSVIAYQAKPKGDGPFPAILVAHENRGLTDYIKDVTRRLAKAGYVALAVDLLSAQGGTDKVTDPAQIPAALSGASPDRTRGPLFERHQVPAGPARTFSRITWAWSASASAAG